MNLKNFIAFIFIVSLSKGQTVVVAKLDTFTRPMPLIGMNTNAHHTIANWKLPAFVESTAVLSPAILRFPGGTVANHWDWKRGWFREDSTTPPELANINPKDTIRIEEFKPALAQVNAEGLFVINFQCSSLEYETEGLKHIAALGVVPKYIEIGNEHNLSISNQFISPSVYAPGTKVWADSIKKYFPAAKICLVGGSPPNQPGWNDSIVAQNAKYDALAFHVYLGAGNADTLFNTQRALSIPFAQLHQRYVQSKFDVLPPDKDVWVTEFNMSEKLAGQPYQHAETWTHALFVASMIHIFLENPRITMIINHNLTNQLEFAAISPVDHHITANGVIMQLIGDVTKGMKNATRLLFTPDIDQTYGTVSFPRLIGWKYDDGTIERGLVLNLSADSIICDLSAVCGTAATMIQFTGDSGLIVSGKQSLSTTSGMTSAPVLLHPYSVSLLFTQHSTNVRRINNKPKGYTLQQNFPNPFNPTAEIRYQMSEISRVSLKVYDVLGKEVAVLVDDVKEPGTYSVQFNGSALSSGIYFYTLQAGNFSATKKLVLMK